VEDKTEGQEKQEPTPTPASSPAPAESKPASTGGSREVNINDFFRIELRVAKVLTAEPVPKTDKLLKLEVDLGSEKRQLVAGVAQVYAPEEIVGKNIVVVANLQPARIRGVESRGMLLAADIGGRPIVATFEEDVPPGTRVR
jgi:methionyl-tRNA synthetase